MLDYKLYSDLDYHDIYINASKQLIEVYRNEIVELHHIGSSSIDGTTVTPTVEILTVVKDINRVQGYIDEMNMIGYSIAALSPDNQDECLLFTAIIEGIAFYVLIVERTDFNGIEKRLAVRDYLRTHSEARLAYKRFKHNLHKLKLNQHDIHNAEREYLKEIEAHAIYWYRMNS